MTETTIVSDSHAHSGRLTRTRLATRAAMIVERLWPLLLPVLLVAALFVSLSWLGAVPADAGHAASGVGAGVRDRCAGGALSAALVPPADAPSRSTGASNAPTGSSTIRFPCNRTGRAARHGAFADALWREHQRRMAERLGRCVRRSAAHAAFRSATRGRCAPRSRCSSSSPSPFRSARWAAASPMRFRPQSAIDAIPPRIDAWVTPPAYTGKAPIFLTSEANQAAPRIHCPERQRGGVARHRRRRRRDAELQRCVGQRAARSPRALRPSPAKPPPPAAPAPRQFAGKLDDRRHADAEVGRQGRPELGVRGHPRQAAGDRVLRRAEAGRQRHAGARLHDIETTTARPRRRPSSRWPSRRRQDAHPLYTAPEMPLALPRRGAAQRGQDRRATSPSTSGPAPRSR